MLDDFKPVRRTPAKPNDTARQDDATLQRASEQPAPPTAPEVPPTVSSGPGSMSTAEHAIAAPTGKVAKKKGRFHLSKKQWIIVGIVSALLIGGAAAFFVFRKKPAADTPAVTTQAKKETPKPTTETANLSGLQVPIGMNALPVTGVIIENSPDARPQAGLIDAGVVYEAIAEGGITRFLALFQHNSVPGYVGPVRSARPYYLDYLSGFDAAIAHVGGSPDALAQIKNEGIKDLDQFANGGAYRRVSNRYAPHNVYSNIADLTALQQKKGFKSSYEAFPRKTEKAVSPPTAKAIDLNISSARYNVHYDYDAPTNSYLRNLDGRAHMDEKSNKQLSPKVVVAIVVPYGIASDRIHSTYQATGSGKAFVFQDGAVTEGTWTKASRKSQIKFTTAAGAPIQFNPGQTWVTLLSGPEKLSYKP